MKIKLLAASVLLPLLGYSQAILELNPSSCGNATGLIEITSGTIYDGYQWYSKPVNSPSDFQLISGSTAPSFNFNWAAYDHTLVKVLVSYTDINVSFFSTVVEINSQNCSLATGYANGATPVLDVFHNNNASVLYVKHFIPIETIQIFNTLGQEVLSRNTAESKTEIDTAHLQPGMYIVHIGMAQNRTSIKFLKT